MSETKLQAARELITERNYSAARAILETIPSDPTAQRWLKKINEVEDKKFAERYNIADSLIEKGQIEAAKTILSEIDTPRAKNWLAELSELYQKPQLEKQHQIPNPNSVITTATDTIDSNEEVRLEEKKRRNNTWTYIIVLLLSCPLAYATLQAFMETSNTSSVDDSAEPQIGINGSGNHAIAEQFLTSLNTNSDITGIASIQFFEAEVSEDNYLFVDLELQLDDSHQNNISAYEVIENLLRHYAATVPHNNAGNITARAYYREPSGIVCGVGGGMGAMIMETIDWQNDSRLEIFNALDRERYTDSVSDRRTIAFRPILTANCW